MSQRNTLTELNRMKSNKDLTGSELNAILESINSIENVDKARRALSRLEEDFIRDHDDELEKKYVEGALSALFSVRLVFNKYFNV